MIKISADSLHSCAKFLPESSAFFIFLDAYWFDLLNHFVSIVFRTSIFKKMYHFAGLNNVAMHIFKNAFFTCRNASLGWTAKSEINGSRSLHIVFKFDDAKFPLMKI